MRSACAVSCGSAAPAGPVLQRKVRLGAVNDPAEREADAVAARVTRGVDAGIAARSGPVARSVQRTANGKPGNRGAEAAAAEVARGGAPLSASQRSYFEPRFGRDLSGVRLHTGASAQRAAKAIGARAYTYGSSIAFAAGEASSGTDNMLLAHELAHAVQQSPGIVRRQPAPYSRTFEDSSGGGSTSYEEELLSNPKAEADGTFTGTVIRHVWAPKTATAPRQDLYGASVNVVFDPNNWEVRVPLAMNFVADTTANNAGRCAGPQNPEPPLVAPAAVTALGDRVVRILNEALNGWFKLRIENCNHPGAGRDLPIRIDVTKSNAANATKVLVLNSRGRSDNGAICLKEFDDLTLVHEGGHQGPRAHDEYREKDQQRRKQFPRLARDERVRAGDLSFMESQFTYGRFAMFHERHFRFAQVFVEAALGRPDCRVNLVRIKEAPKEARITFSGGLVTSNDRTGFYASLGFDLSRPLTTTRRLNLEKGLRAQLLLTPPGQKNALMFGARLGLLAQSNPGKLNVSAGLFGTAGVTALPSLGAYGEVGGKVGIASSMDRGVRLHGEIEAALGRTFGNDSENLKYSRIGVGLVISF